MDAILDFLTKNKDAIGTLLAILALLGTILGALFGALKWLAPRLFPPRAPAAPARVFEVITDPAALLPKIFLEENNPNPLAHHRITYQPRDPDHNTQDELRAALNRTPHYLLITAPTGMGKTREAAMLATSLMNEGWRVVWVKPTRLDQPPELPPEIQADRRRVLLLLDDLNGMFRAGEFTPSPKPREMPLLAQRSYRDRLLDLLNDFEERCGANEIRVIATARDEAREWQKLDYDPNDALWKRFARVELRAPSDRATIELLTDSVARANLRAERADFPAIARANDGTFKNIVLNLQRLQRENKPVTLANYKPSLNGSWREVYDAALHQHRAVRYIYDAIDLLRQTGIDLYRWTVEPTALLVWGGNWLQRMARQREVRRALRYLVSEKIIAGGESEATVRLSAHGEASPLQPHDGQIEAKGTQVDWKQYAVPLQRLVLRLADQRRGAMVDSLWGFGDILYDAKQFEDAAALCRKGTTFAPQNAVLWNNLGVVLGDLQRYPEAEQAYRDAIARDPNDAAAYYNLGNLLLKLQRYPEAEQAYRDAIARDPNLAQAYSNLGSLLRIGNRLAEAIPLLQKSQELKPRLVPLLHLAGIYRQLDDAAASAKYAAEARARVPADDWYNLACLESICGNVDAALEHLRRAAQQEEFDRTWAWQDPDLQWIRDGPRFREIVPKL